MERELQVIFFPGNAVYYLLIPICSIMAVLVIFWSLYLIKRIKINNQERLNALEKSKYDKLGNFTQLADFHKEEVVKFSFLLAINLIESVAMVIYAVGSQLALVLSNKYKPNLVFPDNIEFANCTRDYFQLQDLRPILSTMYLPFNLCVAFGQVGWLMSMSLSICLLKYLHNAYYNRGGNLKWILRLLLLTSLLCVLFIIFSSVKQLFILQSIIEPIIQLTFLCFLIRYLRIYYRTLKRRTIDLKILCKSEETILASTRIVRRFSIISTLNTFAFTCLFLAEFLTQYIYVIATLIGFSSCFTKYAYDRVLYQPPLHNQHQIKQLQYARMMINSMANILLTIGCICIFFEYVLMSVLSCCSNFLRDLKMRFGIGIHPQYIQLRQPLL